MFSFPPSLSLFQAAALSLDHAREKSTDTPDTPSQHLLSAACWKSRGTSVYCEFGVTATETLGNSSTFPAGAFAKESISSVGGPGTQLEMRRKGELNIEELHIQTLSISGAAQPAFVKHWLIPRRFSLRHIFRKRSFGIALISADRSIRVDVYWKKKLLKTKHKHPCNILLFESRYLYVVVFLPNGSILLWLFTFYLHIHISKHRMHSFSLSHISSWANKTNWNGKLNIPPFSVLYCHFYKRAISHNIV